MTGCTMADRAWPPLGNGAPVERRTKVRQPHLGSEYHLLRIDVPDRFAATDRVEDRFPPEANQSNPVVGREGYFALSHGCLRTVARVRRKGLFQGGTLLSRYCPATASGAEGAAHRTAHRFKLSAVDGQDNRWARSSF